MSTEQNEATYPTTPAQWFDSDKVLPSQEEHGPYPRVIVALQYVDHPDLGFSQQMAELRYLGKNKSRPVWLDIKTRAPIETEVLCVRYWANPLVDPPKENSHE